ncbi:MAG: hypothetical protein IPG84_19520 [Betaproteobacteria bacterium]|nr:hypothetical protein [Betaproteobacteria bacterium]
MATPEVADLFRRYGIEPNRRSRGQLDLWLRSQVRRFRLVRDELVAASPMAWPKRLAAWRRGFTANSSFVYRLDVNDPREYVSDWDYYLSGYRFNGFFNPIVGNKLVLSQILAGCGLPHPRVFGVVRKGRPIAIGPGAPGDPGDGGSSLLESWAADGRPLVLRPHWSGAGEGVFFLQRGDRGWQVNRRPAADEDVRRLVAALDRYVVTAFVDQAGYAATIYPDTANTLRVLTLCDADGCFVAAVAHRFGSRRSGSIDNWHRGHGGLNAPIDRARGALGRAVTLRDDGRLIEHERHPDTGQAIEGVAIPGLERALAGLLDAARCLPEAPLIGWDMLMTDDGYSILEANSPPGITVWQVHAPLLRDPRVARFFAAPPS